MNELGQSSPRSDSDPQNDKKYNKNKRRIFGGILAAAAISGAGGALVAETVGSSPQQEYEIPSNLGETLTTYAAEFATEALTKIPQQAAKAVENPGNSPGRYNEFKVKNIPDNQLAPAANLAPGKERTVISASVDLADHTLEVNAIDESRLGVEKQVVTTFSLLPDNPMLTGDGGIMQKDFVASLSNPATFKLKDYMVYDKTNTAQTYDFSVNPDGSIVARDENGSPIPKGSASERAALAAATDHAEFEAFTQDVLSNAQ